MNKIRILLVVFFLNAFAQKVFCSDFDNWFIDKTLRIDYVFSGNKDVQEVSVEDMVFFDGWAGKRNRLSVVDLDGNAQVIMKDKKTGMAIYKYTFSSLMQEWILTDEAAFTRKAFENPILMPFPRNNVIIDVLFRKNDGSYITLLSHEVCPNDILIRNGNKQTVAKYSYIIKNGNVDDCIDLVILPEGYSKDDSALFVADANKACEILFNHNPFNEYKKYFNVIRVDTFSVESGVSIPSKNIWKNSVFKTNFDTFYSDRYLTTSQMKNMHTILECIPYEYIIVLVNSEKYGGGGIYNYYTLTSARDKYFPQVLVHEFGHSFAGLGDEYFYENDINLGLYNTSVEPWEPNLTTLSDFDKKWKDLVDPDVPIPTPESMAERVGVYEGGGYVFKGVYRPVFSDCRMKNNISKHFCPVCERAIIKVINNLVNKDSYEF